MTELVARQPPPPVRFCQVALQTSGLLLPVLCIDMGVVLCHIDAKATASQVPVVVHVLTVVASNSLLVCLTSGPSCASGGRRRSQ